LVWATASGCALHDSPSGSNPFVKPGKPAIEMGKPIKLPKAAASAKGSRGRQRPAADVRPASSLVPTVESTDRALSAALLQVAVAPTPEAHLAVAERYRVLGILDMAYDHYLRASQIDRTDASAYEGLARTWRDWGFPHLGMADASRAVYYAPASASAHNTWGTVLVAVGHDDEARREFERAIQLDPGAAYAWNNLCYLSFLAGDAAQAVIECNEALSADPTLAAARGTLASLGRRDASERVP
jgi:tetratricopeptide (TPR) repeat protein